MYPIHLSCVRFLIQSYLIQNEEFMAELRSDTDFMAALQLEHDEAAVRCDVHSTSEIHISSLITKEEMFMVQLFHICCTKSLSH